MGGVKSGGVEKSEGQKTKQEEGIKEQHGGLGTEIRRGVRDREAKEKKWGRDKGGSRRSKEVQE